MKVPNYGQAPLEDLGPAPDETMLLMAAATMKELGRLPEPEYNDWVSTWEQALPFRGNPEDFLKKYPDHEGAISRQPKDDEEGIMFLRKKRRGKPNPGPGLRGEDLIS